MKQYAPQGNGILVDSYIPGFTRVVLTHFKEAPSCFEGCAELHAPSVAGPGIPRSARAIGSHRMDRSAAAWDTVRHTVWGFFLYISNRENGGETGTRKQTGKNGYQKATVCSEHNAGTLQSTNMEQREPVQLASDWCLIGGLIGGLVVKEGFPMSLYQSRMYPLPKPGVQIQTTNPNHQLRVS